MKVFGMVRLATDVEEPKNNGPYKVRVAWNKRVKNSVTGEYEDQGQFIDAKAFDSVGKTLFTHCPKGFCVVIHGSLEEEKWVDKNTGGNRSKNVIRITQMDFIPKEGNKNVGRKENFNEEANEQGQPFNNQTADAHQQETARLANDAANAFPTTPQNSQPSLTPGELPPPNNKPTPATKEQSKAKKKKEAEEPQPVGAAVGEMPF
jgi:single-stranded DNA-binding protein